MLLFSLGNGKAHPTLLCKEMGETGPGFRDPLLQSEVGILQAVLGRHQGRILIINMLCSLQGQIWVLIIAHAPWTRLSTLPQHHQKNYATLWNGFSKVVYVHVCTCDQSPISHNCGPTEYCLGSLFSSQEIINQVLCHLWN